MLLHTEANFETRHRYFGSFRSYSPFQRNCFQDALWILHMNKMWNRKKKPFSLSSSLITFSTIWHFQKIFIIIIRHHQYMFDRVRIGIDLLHYILHLNWVNQYFIHLIYFQTFDGMINGIEGIYLIRPDDATFVWFIKFWPIFLVFVFLCLPVELLLIIMLLKD